MSGLYGSLPPVGTVADSLGSALPPPPTAAMLAAATPPAAANSAAPPGPLIKPNQFMAPPVRKRPPPVAHNPVKPAQIARKTLATPQSPEDLGTTSLINANQVEDKYDPAFPNDYEEYCKQRTAAKRAEHTTSQSRKRHEDDDDVRDAPTASTDLNVSGDEAYRKRVEMSGGAPAAAPLQQLQPEESAAQRMMKNMGWQSGQGLGSKAQGITSALEHKKTGRTSAVIVQAPMPQQQRPPPVQQQAAPPKKKTVKGRPTKVVLLRNMVAPGEVDEDLQSEVAEECTKYGEVDAVKVFEVKDSNVAPEKAVRIFTKFLRQESAMKALVDLNGRFFGGRTIDVIFFSETRFNEDDISPEKDEFE